MTRVFNAFAAGVNALGVVVCLLTSDWWLAVMNAVFCGLNIFVAVWVLS